MNLLAMIAADPNVDPALRGVLAPTPAAMPRCFCEKPFVLDLTQFPCERRAPEEIGPWQPRPHILYPRLSWCSCEPNHCQSLTNDGRNGVEHCRAFASDQLSEDSL